MSFGKAHAGLLLFGAACVPEGPATSGEVELPEESIVVSAGGDLIEDLFRDDFERTQIGDDYDALSNAWTLKEGWLCVEGAKNQGIWLTRRLPKDVRIEFDAVALSEAGDIKVELFGDGASGATKATYDDATGYIAIFGGWNNTLHVLTRLDEHAADRKKLAVDPSSDDPLARPVQPGRQYHFKLERKRGKLRFEVDGAKVLELDDPKPLAGPGHEHFAFNDWTAPVCFDNLEIEPV